MSSAFDMIRRDYHARLRIRNISVQPKYRDPEEQAAAALEFWAAQSQIVLDAGSLAQAAVESTHEYA